MWNFFKQVLAVIVGFFIIGGVFILFFSAMVIGGISNANKNMPNTVKNEVKENTVLKLNLAYNIKEQNQFDQTNFSLSNFNLYENIGLQNIIRTIEKAKNDSNIKGIYMELSTMPNGFASTDAIRRSLLEFKKSGKFIIAYGEYASQKAYYLASVADKVYINPEGIVEMRGIGTQLSFYKKFLDKLEADVQVFKVGTFKSAIEPYIREDISESNREQLEFLLGGIKEDFLKNISESRNIEIPELEDIINNLKIKSSKDAERLQIIDGAKYEDEVMDVIADKIEITDEEDIHFVKFAKYAMGIGTYESLNNDKIAVVYAEGEIMSKKSPEVLSSEQYAKLISKLRTDDDVKAIVLRVNSPGGSALASDVIWRELELAKETKKIIVSMGNVAASGGYYIASGADYIFAEENTITGSIGVYGLVPNMEKFLENKIGVTFDEVNLNDHATMNGVTNSFDDAEHQMIQSGVNRVYQTFTSKVASGRNMPIEKVKKYAEGRVWTGEQAVEIGFVDKIGDLSDAISYASELVNLDKSQIEEYPGKKDAFEEIMEQFGMEMVKERIIKSELGKNYKYFNKVKNIESQMNTIQVRMPFDIEIK